MMHSPEKINTISSKEGSIQGEREQIDIVRVKRFLKHITTAHIKINEREEARTELKEHVNKLRTLPGISKTKRVEEALAALEEKIISALKKERELMAEHQEESSEIKNLAEQVIQLKEKIKDIQESTKNSPVAKVKKKRTKKIKKENN